MERLQVGRVVLLFIQKKIKRGAMTRKLNWVMFIAGVIGVLLVFTIPCHASKLLALVKNPGGWPNLENLPYHGFVKVGDRDIGNWGLYMISGNDKQLKAINELPENKVVGLVIYKERYRPDSDTVEIIQKELDDDIPANVLTKVNAWLTDRGKPTITDETKNKRVVKKIINYFNRDNSNLEVNNWDIADFELFYITPASVVAGSNAIDITVKGWGFVPESVVKWKADELVTTFVDNETLTARVPKGKLDTAGTAKVSVLKVSGSHVETDDVTFTIQ
jgi:hypothetical protein